MIIELLIDILLVIAIFCGLIIILAAIYYMEYLVKNKPTWLIPIGVFIYIFS